MEVISGMYKDNGKYGEKYYVQYWDYIGSLWQIILGFVYFEKLAFVATLFRLEGVGGGLC